MNLIVPVVPVGGNTKSPTLKQISPAIRWCFTLNNYTEMDISSIVPVVRDKCKCAIIGKEIGESETPHLQGYLEFKSKSRPIGIFNNSRIHFEKSKGSKEENETYCSKENEVILSFGFPVPIMTINRADMYKWQEKLVKIFEVPCKWDCRKIYWRYGPVGIGKSQFAKWLCVKLGAVVIEGEKRHLMSQVQNAKAPIYIMLLAYGDEEISYRAVEKIKDGLFSSCFGCDNNSMVISNAPHMLIIGNEPPNRDNRNFHPEKYDVCEIGI